MHPFDERGIFRMPDCGAQLRGVAIRGAGVTLSAQIGTFVVQLVGVSVLARILFPSDFGLIAVVTTFSIFLTTLVKIGFPEAILQHQGLTHQIASNVFWIDLGLSAACSLGFAATGPLIARLYNDPKIAHLVPVMSLSIFLTGASVVHSALLDRGMQFSANAANTITSRIVSVLVSIVLAKLGWGYWALAGGVIAQPLSICVGAWSKCRWLPGLPRRSQNTSSLVSFALHVNGTANLGYWTSNLDNVLVGWRFGAGSLGFYKKAYDLFALPANQLFSTFPVGIATLSRLAKNPVQYRRYFLNGLSALAMIGMCAAGAMTLTGRDLMRLILGPKWGMTGWIFTIFAPGIGVMLIYKTTGMIHLSIGTPHRLLRWSILELVVTALLFLLALHWGPIGVAAAWTASYCLLIVPAFWYAGSPIQLTVPTVVRKIGGYMLAALMAAYVCILIMHRFHWLAAMPNWSGALLRVLANSLLFSLLYLGGVVVVYRGFAPLREFAGVLQDMISAKRSTSSKSVAETTLVAHGRSAGSSSIFRRIEAIFPGVVFRALRQMRVRFLSRGLPTDRVFEQSSEYSTPAASMSIVVPIHDAPQVARRCLTSLERYASKAEVIIVDDASKLITTLDIIKDFTSRNNWKLVRHEAAQGHSEACSVGASLATRSYLCLLNSDTVVTPWCWSPIKAAFDSDPKIGVAGPSTSDSANEQTFESAKYCRFHWTDSQIGGFAERLVRGNSESAVLDIPWVSGFAFFIRLHLWQELGGFDKSLTDYGNEQELCRRVAKAGYRRVWVRSSYIHHLGGQSYEGLIGKAEMDARRLAGDAYLLRKHADSFTDTLR